MLDPKVQEALEKDLIIDITTTGRKSGSPRRKEIWFHNLDGSLYIVGLVLPGSRSWYANVLADPRITFHLKETTQADLPAPRHAHNRRLRKTQSLGADMQQPG